jgi:formylglycine-generating enzyme required for sulfatase activity
MPLITNQSPNLIAFSAGSSFGQSASTGHTPKAPRPSRNQTAILWIMGTVILILLVMVIVLLASTKAASPIPVVSATPSAPPQPLLLMSETSSPAPVIFNTLPAPTQLPSLPPTTTVSPTIAPTLSLTPNSMASETPDGGPPSCTTAGQTWVRPADKMAMVCIPAGSFTIGMDQCDFAGCEKEVNGGNVNLSAYWIDRTEVTNSMFQEFVAQTGYITGAETLGASEVYGLLAPVAGANWRSPQGAGSTASANQPVVQMNWYSANAYCKWAGGMLPSEAEWEKAARGTDGRLWPWGNALPSEKLVNAADVNVPAPQSRTDQNDGYRYTSPVGAFPAGQSPYGLMDMAGNAWEWTRSIYRDYPYSPDDGREVRSLPEAGDKMVIRGGCWFDDYGAIRSTMRYGGLPEGSTNGTGFRCVLP